jgi:hypothetical protein
MFSLDNVVLPKFLVYKLAFLSEYGVEFGYFYWYMETIFWIPAILLVLLFTKNSMEKLEDFTLNYKTALFTGFVLTAGIMSLNKVSEFLYFNF